jgi:Protein of unknown function (DUF551)
MNKWINVKKQLPENKTNVQIKLDIFFVTKEEAIFIDNRFIINGEDVTKHVTHWRRSPEMSKDD